MLLLLLCVLPLACAQLQVNTTEGLVEGAKAADGSYYNFFGLHYGGPTSGANRFKAPTPPPKYPGLFHAIDNNVMCSQPTESGFIGTENCLTLSIFTNNTGAPKPVLVWLEDSEYAKGGKARSFARLVERDVVVVQPNYRLSIFGFLCLGVAEAPGNAGLKDIVQALKWIKNNIAGFGGDPNNVILFGHGSGAALVDLITMSPLANGLVHKAIAQSGSALAPWAIAYEPLKAAHNFGAKLGYGGKSNEDLAKHLQETELAVLQTGFHNIELFNNTALFAPCIENAKLNGSETFLADAPINILKSGNYKHIPYIAGYTNAEGTLRAGQAVLNNWLSKMQTNFSQFLPVDLDYRSNQTGIQSEIRNFYFGEKVIDMSTIEDYLNYHGDTLVLVSVIRGARERSAKSKADVRLYEFTNKGTQNSDWAYNTIPLNGARHGIIINYLLDIDLRPVDTTVRVSLTNRFISFFNTGNPSSAMATWSPVKPESFNYLLYSSTDAPTGAINGEELRINPHTNRMTKWDDLYSKYYVTPKPVSSSERIIGVAVIVAMCQFMIKLF